MPPQNEWIFLFFLLHKQSNQSKEGCNEAYGSYHPTRPDGFRSLDAIDAPTEFILIRNDPRPNKRNILDQNFLFVVVVVRYVQILLHSKPDQSLKTAL